MAFKHEINSLKDRGDKNHVDENVSDHGTVMASNKNLNHCIYSKNGKSFGGMAI